MPDERHVLDAIHASFNQEPRLAQHTRAATLRYDGRSAELTIEGEVEHIAAKRLLLERAAAVAGVDRVVDRLRVQPAEHMQDGEIRSHVMDALSQESTLSEHILKQWTKGREETLQEPRHARGSISVRVEEGVVTLDGSAASLSHKRLAGVLAWWVPGSRDVINGLEVDPPEEDTDDELRDAVRLVLEKDPFVDATSIQARAKNGVVTLHGAVPRESEKQMAEHDVWYIFGVDDVRSEELEVLG